MTDYAIVYRIIDGDHIGEFRELVFPDRRILSMVFNPQKRSKKMMHDLANSLGRLVASGKWNNRNIPVSFPYVALLNYLSALHPRGRVQFCLLSTRGRRDTGEPQVVLTSAVHQV
jgi:hypothetical protein